MSVSRQRFHVQTCGALLGAFLLAGCGAGAGRRPTEAQPGTAQETLSELFNLTGLYQRVGRLAAGPPLPFVGQVVFLAGRGDSTVAMLALSLDNRMLSFQRSGRDFVARYRVDMQFQQSGSLGVRYARDNTVSVASFQETQRTDESVVFQQAFLLEPGEYTLSVTVRDPGSGSFSRAEQALTVPKLSAGATTAPILVYQATPRANLWSEPGILLNPRGMVAHGDDSLGVYVEGYGLTETNRRIPLRITDEAGRLVYDGTVEFGGGQAVEARMVYLPAETPSLGRLTMRLGEGGGARETIALISFSRTWVLTNYDNLLDLLRYFGYDERLQALRGASAEERPALWRRFWVETDPNPATPENEALDIYFTRVAIANQRYRDEGGASGGWRTERGEVFITLGEPDMVYESPPGRDPRIIQWSYNDYRAVLTFQGQLGFSRVRLTTESRGEFARLRTLVRQRQTSRP